MFNTRALCKWVHEVKAHAVRESGRTVPTLHLPIIVVVVVVIVIVIVVVVVIVVIVSIVVCIIREEEVEVMLCREFLRRP